MELVKCIAKSTIVANIHTWSFCVEKLQRIKQISSMWWKDIVLALYEAEGQAKYLKKYVPGIDNGWQRR